MGTPTCLCTCSNVVLGHAFWSLNGYDWKSSHFSPLFCFSKVKHDQQLNSNTVWTICIFSLSHFISCPVWRLSGWSSIMMSELCPYCNPQCQTWELQAFHVPMRYPTVSQTSNALWSSRHYMVIISWALILCFQLLKVNSVAQYTDQVVTAPFPVVVSL